MAKSKKERRSSIRHMAAEDTLGILEALERAEQQETPSRPEPVDTDEDEPETEASRR